jgi:isopenicillin N synthase-like dioxygenase
MPLLEAPQIPKFNLEDLKQGIERDRLRECLTRPGIFFVTGTAPKEADHKSARDAALDFFEHGAASEKKSVSPREPTIRSGFTGFEAESTARITDSGNYTDFSTCYSMRVCGNVFPTTT